MPAIRSRPARWQAAASAARTLLLVASISAAATSAQASGRASGPPAEPALIHARFVCADGRWIEAAFDNRPPARVMLTLADGRRLTLPQAVSASGARYADPAGRTVFWNKGDTAFVDEQGRRTYADCRVAR